jgi:hypothetical protein
MARRDMRKTRPASGRNSSQAEAVEQLRDAVGRLIARRILREWTLTRGTQDTAATPPAGAKRPR